MESTTGVRACRGRPLWSKRDCWRQPTGPGCSASMGWSQFADPAGRTAAGGSRRSPAASALQAGWLRSVRPAVDAGPAWFPATRSSPSRTSTGGKPPDVAISGQPASFDPAPPPRKPGQPRTAQVDPNRR